MANVPSGVLTQGLPAALADVGNLANLMQSRLDFGSRGDLPLRIIKDAQLQNFFNPFGGPLIQGVLVGIEAGINAVAKKAAQRQARQDRRQFQRTFARLAGPQTLQAAGFTSKAIRRGIGGATDPKRGAFGFTLPIPQAAFVAARLTRPRKSRKLLGGPNPDQIIRGFGVGPGADALREIEFSKFRRQAGVRLAGGNLPAPFTRRRL